MAGTDIVKDYLNYNTHANFAEQYARARGFDASATNAFVHAYVSAMITFERGEYIAKFVGDAREWSTTEDYYKNNRPDYRTDTFRDLYNNMIGRDIGKYASDNDLSQRAVANLVERSLDRGDLIKSISKSNPDPRIPDITDDPHLFGQGDGVGKKCNGWPDDFDRLNIINPWFPPRPHDDQNGSGGFGGTRFPPTHPGRWDPLVVDLNGDGVKLTPLEGSKVNFDFGADGFAEQTGWVSAQDGLVVFDRNKNGRIDNGTELFGNANEDGFAALAKFDGNKDGVIDARDAVFANLRIWRDANGNGLTDAGELLTLAQAERHRIARGHWPSIRSRRALNRLRVRSQNGWHQERLHSARGRLSCDKPGREYRPIKCVMGG